VEDDGTQFKVKRLVLGVLVIWLAVFAATAQARPSRNATAAYSAALRVWKGAVCASAAAQSGSEGLWWRAASDLSRARPEPRGYEAAAGRLRNLALLPETDATARQMEEGSSDTKYLDGFFHTPGLYISAPSQCPL
jgi:hypothetical protein